MQKGQELVVGATTEQNSECNCSEMHHLPRVVSKQLGHSPCSRVLLEITVFKYLSNFCFVSNQKINTEKMLGISTANR